MDRVVVLITVHKADVAPLERVSLLQCMRVLGAYPIRLICPVGMDTSQYLALCPGLVVDPIPAHWQSSYANFAKLKIDTFLYRRYSAYEYVLFYELDAFVFRDELPHWCGRAYDYIGAPWLQGYVAADQNSGFVGVGNGGFSLRKTASLIRGRRSRRLWLRMLLSTARRAPGRAARVAAGEVLRTLRHPFGDDADPEIVFERGEDSFWGLTVARHLSWFKVAPVDEALKFSFEAAPRKLFALNGDRPPFGCHAWARYDFDFWRPHIERCGYDLSDLRPPETVTYHALPGATAS